MSDKESVAPVGDNTGASGSVEQKDATATSGAVDGVYKPEFVQKLKKEKDNWKAKYDELASKVQAETESDLQSQMQYKQLWESEKQAKAALAEKLGQTQEQIKQAKVKSAVKTELAKLGLMHEHWDTASRLVNWENVQLDPDTEMVINADGESKSFFDKYSSLGFFNRNGVRVNHQAPTMVKPGQDISKMTYDEKLNALKDRAFNK